MVFTQADLHMQAHDFLQALFTDMARSTVQLSAHWDIDHLCYRTSSDAKYQEFKREFLNFAKLLTETPVNGRLISTFQLNTPIYFQKWRIDLVELPAPKKGKPTQDGFEHIEVVCDQDFSEIKKRHADLRWDESGLAKDLNAELELCLGTRNIKFHHLSLASVIEIEKNEVIDRVLKKSQVLGQFKEYSPIVVGTFPLGLQTEGSDLDILMQAKDLRLFEGQLRKVEWGPAAIVEHSRVENVPTLTANFKVDDVPFEIFVQETAPVRQRAFLHFQIEERLLKWGGDPLRQRVRELRRQGVKTEPAFAQALSLEGDPYRELLQMQRLDPVELLKVLNERELG